MAGWETVQLRKNVKEALQEIYINDTKRAENQKFSAWFDNMLSEYIEYNKELATYGPFLEYWNAHGNMINLFDHRTQEPVSVFLDGPDKLMKCSKCKTKDCVHVGFCFAIPEVYKVLIKHGFKEPISLKKGKKIPLMLPFLGFVL
jgi:hypothetical protein